MTNLVPIIYIISFDCIFACLTVNVLYFLECFVKEEKFYRIFWPFIRMVFEFSLLNDSIL